jgi:homoserine O-acetyltransferase
MRSAPTPQIEDFEIPIPASFTLASGDRLSEGCVRLRRYGAGDAPHIAALGGISAGRAIFGQGGWWNDTFARLDLAKVAVLGFDFAPLGDERVRITPLDQARLIEHALNYLDIHRLGAFVGASYGGMIGLALAAQAPERIGELCVISAAHRPAAQALAWRGVQRRMLEFALQHGDANSGLSLARQLAMITYRTSEEFEARFGSGVDADGLGEVDRYLIARGDAYGATMGAKRWLSLSEAIDRFAVNPDAVKTSTTVIACSSDQLAPIGDMRALAAALPNLRAFHEVSSLYGHDAFLKEPEQLSGLLNPLIEEVCHG